MCPVEKSPEKSCLLRLASFFLISGEVTTADFFSDEVLEIFLDFLGVSFGVTY
jgi:hypothetical protein